MRRADSSFTFSENELKIDTLLQDFESHRILEDSERETERDELKVASKKNTNAGSQSQINLDESERDKAGKIKKKKKVESVRLCVTVSGS